MGRRIIQTRKRCGDRMTSVQTKKELNKEFKDVKYILTSSMRSKLLLAVYNAPKNLEELRNELQKPSATILHGLKELENINLIMVSTSI